MNQYNSHLNKLKQAQRFDNIVGGCALAFAIVFVFVCTFIL